MTTNTHYAHSISMPSTPRSQDLADGGRLAGIRIDDVQTQTMEFLVQADSRGLRPSQSTRSIASMGAGAWP